MPFTEWAVAMRAPAADAFSAESPRLYRVAAFLVGDGVAADAGGGVRDRHRGAGDDTPGRIGDRAGDSAADRLRECRARSRAADERQTEDETRRQPAEYRRLHGFPSR